MSDPQHSPLQLFIVRHGETEWALTGQHTGVSEIPLTAHGEDEARALAPAFRDLAFTRVLVSPRQRARRTCELAGLGALAETEPNLAEWGYGEYEGLTPAEIDARRPGWEVFRDGCPGGETPTQAADRADRLLKSLSGLAWKCRPVHPRPFRPRPRGEVDRPADRRRRPLLAAHRIDRHSRLRPRPSRRAGYRAVERGSERPGLRQAHGLRVGFSLILSRTQLRDRSRCRLALAARPQNRPLLFADSPNPRCERDDRHDPA